MFFAPSKSKQRSKRQSGGVSKASDHIQIKIKMLNSRQEPPAPAKAPNQDLKDMDGLCTFKIKIEGQIFNPVRNLQHPLNPQIRGLMTWMFFAPSKSRQRAKALNMGVSKTSHHFQINIRKIIPSQKPPLLSKAPNQYFQDMDILCTFKIKIESQRHGCTKDQVLYQNQHPDAKPQSGTFTVLQS